MCKGFCTSLKGLKGSVTSYSQNNSEKVATILSTQHCGMLVDDRVGPANLFIRGKGGGGHVSRMKVST